MSCCDYNKFKNLKKYSFEMEILTPGSGYTNGFNNKVETFGGNGEGATFSIIVNDGNVTLANHNNDGNGYVINDTLRLIGGNNNAILKITNIIETTIKIVENNCQTISERAVKYVTNNKPAKKVYAYSITELINNQIKTKN